MKKLILAILLIISGLTAFSQQATDIYPNAVTVPRFANATAMNTAIPSPVQGMFIYRNDTQSFWYFTSAGWANLAAAVSGAWSQTGSNISNTNTGNVGIGTSSPTTAKLVISGVTAAEGIDLSSSDQYANMRVIRNSLSAFDKDMFIGYQSGSNSSLRLFSNNNETVTVKNTNVGIGVLNPDFPLVTKGRISIQDLGGGESAGIWFNNNGNSALNTFLGIDPSNQLGIYSQALTKNIFTANMSTGGVRIEGPSVSSPSVKTLSIGGYGKIEVDAPGVSGGRFSILENGAIGVSNGTGTAGHVLTSNGAGNGATWQSLNTWGEIGTTKIDNFSSTTWTALVNSNLTLNLDKPSKVIIYYRGKTNPYNGCLAGFCIFKWAIRTRVDGVSIGLNSYSNNNLGTFVFDGIDPTGGTIAYSEGAWGSSVTQGPVVLLFSAGTHTINFDARSLFNNPSIGFSAVYQIIPQ
jgi:hypothetical protein